MTEEAYLTALANSLGTSYDHLDDVSRADCPLGDEALIEAAAAGLLPLRQGRDQIWVITPNGPMARRLADPRESWPARSFRLTSSDRLRHFVMRHAQRTLGGRAADSLRRDRPLLSNAPLARGGRSAATGAFVLLVFLFAAAAPVAMIDTLSGSMCTLFLAAAILRLCSVYFARKPIQEPAKRPGPVSDAQLPIYTIICALYREATVVDDLVAAIRALDYPGIMAQTPETFRSV
jgi:glycosyltransferase XagB